MAFAVVPDFVINNKSLNSTDKLVMGIINSLSLNNNTCFASNDYFSSMLNLSNRTITSAIAKLKKENLIEITTVNSRRNIYLKYDEKKYISSPSRNNLLTGIDKYF